MTLFVVIGCWGLSLLVVSPAVQAQETVSIFVNTTKPKAQALAFRDGSREPVTSCSTPCTLELPANERLGIVVTYRQFPPELLIIDTGKYDPADATYLKENPLEVGWSEPELVKSEIENCQKNLKTYNPGLHAEAKPCYRIAPTMPAIAHQSGFCEMRFDIGIAGRPMNIKPDVCSEVYFAGHAMHAVHNWRYYPEFENGQAVIRKNVEVKVSFRLADELGNMLPGRVILDNEKMDWINAAKDWYPQDD
ncbi:energy transducer TonB [Robiginitomaculum antarcticum]|uniref:energy transducer TonB n=1 Tax=Robiginitomaculum antarcticum TaxID=437507 RepID=UPI0014616A48|nr:energy transducer TonB [Robiginitomaculum antarcticum]